MNDKKHIIVLDNIFSSKLKINKIVSLKLFKKYYTEFNITNNYNVSPSIEVKFYIPPSKVEKLYKKIKSILDENEVYND